jgi:hypothetical protein
MENEIIPQNIFPSLFELSLSVVAFSISYYNTRLCRLPNELKDCILSYLRGSSLINDESLLYCSIFFLEYYQNLKYNSHNSKMKSVNSFYLKNNFRYLVTPSSKIIHLSGCQQITSKSVLQIIRMCTALEHLYLGGCTSIDVLTNSILKIPFAFDSLILKFEFDVRVKR